MSVYSGTVVELKVNKPESGKTSESDGWMLRILLVLMSWQSQSVQMHIQNMTPFTNRHIGRPYSLTLHRTGILSSLSHLSNLAQEWMLSSTEAGRRSWICPYAA